MSLPLSKYLPGLGKKSQIRTADIADGQITAAKLAATVLSPYVDVTITTGQLLALNATPKDIVPAPGAGLAIVPLGAVLFLDFNSVAYDGIAAGEDLSFKWTDKNGAEMLQVETTGFLDQGSDQVRFAQPSATLLVPVANAKVVLHLLVGEIATGDSPLKVRFYYRIVPAVL